MKRIAEQSPLTRRRFVLASSGLVVLSACAAPRPTGTPDATQVAAPAWRPGQTWTWRRTDPYTRLPAGDVTRRIVGREGDAWRVEDSLDAGRSPFDRALYAAPGMLREGMLSDFGPVAGRYAPALPLYAFPLQSGKTWDWRGTRTDASGFSTPMSMRARVEGWETVDVLGKPTRALLVTRTFYLGPPDPFRGNLERHEREWYAPELGGPARIRSEEYFFVRRFSQALSNGYRYDMTLTSATPGA